MHWSLAAYAALRCGQIKMRALRHFFKNTGCCHLCSMTRLWSSSLALELQK